MGYIEVWVDEEEFEEGFLDALRDGEYDEHVKRRAEALGLDFSIAQTYHEILHPQGVLTVGRCREYPCNQVEED
ncbi:hypothetical protein HWB79_gp081 [Streptomyces phage LukeCage]|jgi:hypothetical protein|uniref:Uncharacterized protein n=1 Tax=Streptomyces phage LukeCage TaxID=2283304 RepID=A0A345MGP8_9CAUD|nr:hypothetical protein HWB79_gp081 [Streptomyces phage LukeCage]AXH69729.1 hypothetical protein SEA_LUKECAGE_246 [Streptomyces phage LukeCage]